MLEQSKAARVGPAAGGRAVGSGGATSRPAAAGDRHRPAVRQAAAPNLTSTALRHVLTNVCLPSLLVALQRFLPPSVLHQPKGSEGPCRCIMREGQAYPPTVDLCDLLAIHSCWHHCRTRAMPDKGWSGSGATMKH